MRARRGRSVSLPKHTFVAVSSIEKLMLMTSLVNLQEITGSDSVAERAEDISLHTQRTLILHKHSESDGRGLAIKQLVSRCGAKREPVRTDGAQTRHYSVIMM